MSSETSEEDEFEEALNHLITLGILVGRLKSMRRRPEQEGVLNLTAIKMQELLIQSKRQCLVLHKDRKEEQKLEKSSNSS